MLRDRFICGKGLRLPNSGFGQAHVATALAGVGAQQGSSIIFKLFFHYGIHRVSVAPDWMCRACVGAWSQGRHVRCFQNEKPRRRSIASRRGHINNGRDFGGEQLLNDLFHGRHEAAGSAQLHQERVRVGPFGFLNGPVKPLGNQWMYGVTDAIYAIAGIGAIFLLFTVGLETQPKELISVGRTSLYVALAGIATPVLFGFVYMMARHHTAHEAIFVAAAMAATSVGITARVLGDMHVLQTFAARVVLGAAVFDDVLGMILLSVVVGIVSSVGLAWAQLLITPIEAGGFALIMMFYAPRVVRRMEPGLERMSTQDAPLIIALAICLGLSYAAVKIGMAAIIGAFFAGLAFAEYSPRWNLRPRIFAINEFLAPFFFFSMGARFDMTVFDRKLVISALIISALACFSKLTGCSIPVLRSG